MATAIERRETLRLTAFDEFKKDYTQKVPVGLRVKIQDSRSWELFRRVESAARMAFNFKIFSIPHILTLASNWNYRDNESLEKHSDAVRNFFSPIDIEHAKKILDECRSKNLKLIGVHIRRADYKSFQCGRYFFADDVYAREMRSVHALFGEVGKVEFLVFSDEKINETHFVDLPCQFMHGTAVEDQWMMSQCDFLMGPPSTFSAWASFMGGVPLARMWDDKYRLKLEDFVYRGLQA